MSLPAKRARAEVKKAKIRIDRKKTFATFTAPRRKWAAIVSRLENVRPKKIKNSVDTPKDSGRLIAPLKTGIRESEYVLLTFGTSDDPISSRYRARISCKRKGDDTGAGLDFLRSEREETLILESLILESASRKPR